MLPIGFVPWKRPGRWFRFEPRAVVARELVGVQSHLGRECSHVRPSVHSTGQAGEVVVLDGRERLLWMRYEVAGGLGIKLAAPDR